MGKDRRAFGVSVRGRTYDKLKELAQREGVSMREIVERIVYEAMPDEPDEPEVTL